MGKFKQKSPVVDAVPWKGDNEEEVKALMPAGAPPALFTKDGTVDIWTPRGILRAHLHDWLVKDSDGDVGVVRFESFVSMFDVIQETDKKGKAYFKDAEARKAALDKQLKEGHHGQA